MTDTGSRAATSARRTGGPAPAGAGDVCLWSSLRTIWLVPAS